MFLDLDQKPKGSIAAIDDSGGRITYGELMSFSEDFINQIGNRTLIFILSQNSIGSLAGYVAALRTKVVPLLLGSGIDREMLKRLIHIYQPEFLWIPDEHSKEFNYKKKHEKYGFSLLETSCVSPPLYEDLSLLLSTSGSTGSPKLVRHSYSNIESNARNVAELFGLCPEDKPIAILPMHYTMGLSVITSHLYAGACILLMNKKLTDPDFWSFIKEKEATSFTGVPTSFEILHKLRFFRMKLPHLKLLAQGGGKLREDLFREFAEFAESTGRKFIATYGQTEGTARMAFLSAEMAKKKIGSIGGPIPSGQLAIVDDEGCEIQVIEATGQMVYRGPNVTLGYANKSDDLLKGDENRGVLYTGDIVRRDAEGYYYVIGRMTRFLKIFGSRISLDELELMIRTELNIDCLCSGTDELLKVYVTDERNSSLVKKRISDKTGLFHQVIDVSVVPEIKKNEAGKAILFQQG